MRRKNITAGSIVILLLLFSGTGEAATFTLETFMSGARVRGEGAIDLSSPDRLSISFIHPREVHLALKDDAARVLREVMAGGRAEICAGVSVTRTGTRPHAIRIDFPHETYMVLTLEPGESAAGVYENGLYDAAFIEKGRVFPFFSLSRKRARPCSRHRCCRSAGSR